MQPTLREGVAVLLLSYNRPQMLELAYSSIRAKTGRVEIILVDDGSDAFDPTEWAQQHGIRCRVFASPRSIDQRMTQANLGRLINGALHLAYNRLKVGSIAYLCDDDLFGPDWLDTVQCVLDQPSGPHVMRGRWRSFDDPLTNGPLANPSKSRLTPLDIRKMTTGNFAHRSECYMEGFRWSEKTVAVHDDTALWNLHAIHPFTSAVEVKVLAGYRREHAWNMARYTSHTEYAVGAEKALKRGVLE